MKKRSPADHDLSQHEESLLHKFSESNSAYIAFSSPYLDIPNSPTGKDRTAFGVGNLITDTKRSFYKTPMTWKVLEVCKCNGFVSYQCELVITESDIATGDWKKNDPRTKTNHFQKDVELVEKAIQPKTTKRQPNKKKAK